MKRAAIFISILLFKAVLISKSFQVTPIDKISWDSFRIDKHANTMYWVEMILPNWDAVHWETELTTFEHRISRFPSKPQFANLSHKAVYTDSTDFYLYDFENGTTTYLFPNNTGNIIGPPLEFSPDDRYLLTEDFIYSFETNTFSNTPSLFKDWIGYMNWKTDTTALFFWEGYGNRKAKIYEQHIVDGSIVDSIPVHLDQYDFITGFKYNRELNTLAYSLYENYPKLHYLDLTTLKDSIVFDSKDYKSICPSYGSPAAFYQFDFASNNQNLVFANVFLTFMGSSLFVHKYDSAKTYFLLPCDDYGDKFTPRWINNDTIIYNDDLTGTIKGVKVFSATTPVLEHEQLQKSISELKITAYPNPFNSETNVEISIPQNDFYRIFVYNTLGEKILTLAEGNINPGVYNYNIDGTNMASGVYIILIENRNRVYSYKTVLMK